MNFRPFRALVFILIIFVCFSSYQLAEAKGTTEKFDVLIKGAQVYDGSLKPAFRADVAIQGDSIVKVAKSISGDADQVINAKGLYICPGFIDLHTHADRGMYFPEQRSASNYLKQGVTTLVVGQCGTSAWPIFEKAEDQRERWSQEGIGPNVAMLVGHGSVRNIVIGMEDRPPTDKELEKMKALVREAMDQGATGISTGLIYRPGIYAKTDEIIELVKEVAAYGGIYHTHIRDERDFLPKAVEEAIEISRQTGVPTHISHFKVMGVNNWGKVKEACAIIEHARQEGLVITADQYPYRFSNTYPYRPLIPASVWQSPNVDRLTSSDIDDIFSHLRDAELIALYKKTTPYIPLNANHRQFLADLSRDRLVQFVRQSVFSGASQGPMNTRERMLFINRLNDPVHGQNIREQVEGYLKNYVGAENFVVGVCVNKEYEGKSIKDVATLMGVSLADAAIKLELMGAYCIPFQMHENDIEYIMGRDYVSTGSDGSAVFYGMGLTHVRSYSTFLHKLKKYALTRKSVSVPHVIRSQTSLPAAIGNWKDRGWIKEGYKADIVVLDLKHIKNKTTITNPHQYSEGVKYLLINGITVLDNGEFTGKLPGQVLTNQRFQDSQ